MPKNFSTISILISVAILLLFRVSAIGSNTVPQEIYIHDTLVDSLKIRETIDADSVSDKNFQKEKVIASILAFPVPFGFTGLHRIYLGSEPWVPVAYLVTGGGGCGLLPLIDFIYIVSANEEEFKNYENNPRMFMWVR